MKLCELCIQQKTEGQCDLGRRIPLKMRCVDFTPSIEKFCGERSDYTGQAQLRQMSIFFGLAGSELQRVLTLNK